jgi:hypothetical protein
MNDTPTKPPAAAIKTDAPVNLEERDRLLAGLAEVKRRALTIPHRHGSKASVRVQLQMTATEHAMVNTIRHTASFVMGRPISKALMTRVALSALVRTCTAALKDPAQAEKFKADILRTYNERQAEIGKAANQ